MYTVACKNLCPVRIFGFSSIVPMCELNVRGADLGLVEVLGSRDDEQQQQQQHVMSTLNNVLVEPHDIMFAPHFDFYYDCDCHCHYYWHHVHHLVHLYHPDSMFHPQNRSAVKFDLHDFAIVSLQLLPVSISIRLFQVNNLL